MITSLPAAAIRFALSTAVFLVAVQSFSASPDEWRMRRQIQEERLQRIRNENQDRAMSESLDMTLQSMQALNTFQQGPRDHASAIRMLNECTPPAMRGTPMYQAWKNVFDAQYGKGPLASQPVQRRNEAIQTIQNSSNAEQLAALALLLQLLANEQGKQQGRATTSFVPNGSWKAGAKHPSIRHVVASDTVNQWKPEAGYDWIAPASDPNRLQKGTRWKPGTKHPSVPNVVASSTEGNWRPDIGYAWNSNPPVLSRGVHWVPGMSHPAYPHIVASDKEKSWRPADGWRFANDKKGDFSVVRKQAVTTTIELVTGGGN